MLDEGNISNNISVYLGRWYSIRYSDKWKHSFNSEEII